MKFPTKFATFVTAAGAASACSGGSVTVSSQEQALYAAPSSYHASYYYGYTGSFVQSVSPYAVQTNMYLQPSWQLDSGLNPYAGLGPNGPSIYGSSLGGVSVNGATLVAGDLIGTELRGATGAGEDVTLRIEDVRRGEDENRDVLYYSVGVVDGQTSSPMCGVDADGEAISALVLPGAWDQEIGRAGKGGWTDTSDGSFFFACRGSSVAKCFEMGFKPWLLNVHGNRVTSLHQACVRALRADYCGDGRSWTVPGVELSVWTEAGQSPAQGSHTFEAVWGHEGANCVEATRTPWTQGEGPDCVKIKKKCQEKNKNKNVLFTGFAPEVGPEESAPSSTSKKNKKKK